jgi:hypothetical protein
MSPSRQDAVDVPNQLVQVPRLPSLPLPFDLGDLAAGVDQPLRRALAQRARRAPLRLFFMRAIFLALKWFGLGLPRGWKMAPYAIKPLHSGLAVAKSHERYGRSGGSSFLPGCAGQGPPHRFGAPAKPRHHRNRPWVRLTRSTWRQWREPAVAILNIYSRY